MNCCHWHSEKIHFYSFIIKLICHPSHYWVTLGDLQYHKTQNQIIRELKTLSPKINKKLDKKESICNRVEVRSSPNLLTTSGMEARFSYPFRKPREDRHISFWGAQCSQGLEPIREGSSPQPMRSTACLFYQSEWDGPIPLEAVLQVIRNEVNDFFMGNV